MSQLDAKQREALRERGQGHVFDFLERLAPGSPGRERLEGQLAAVDLDEVERLRSLLGGPPETGGEDFAPPDLFPLRRTPEQADRAVAAHERGAELLKGGRVGFVLVAGGQASRLGYDGPKGEFPVGPVSDTSLFAFHAARLSAASKRFGCRTPWYVMTSAANDGPTRAFFEAHRFFGLPSEDVIFFTQEMLPALDTEGRLLFQEPDSLFLAPNGHGGTLLALASSGALDDMRERGLTQLSYFQVDNPLARPADPTFLGLHSLAEAGMSSKVVPKRDAGEKVGVLGRIDGTLGCIEYSDLPDELREARDADGELRFRAGNIAVHVLAVDFVERVTRGGLELPWHVAKKRMKVAEPDGAQREVDGFKFETFVFDALAHSPSSVTLEVRREEEFSPVKNKSGEDSPATARRDLCRLFAGWAQAGGLELPAADGEGNLPVEVDPRLAETQDEFLARLPLAPDVRPNGHLYA